MDGGEGKRCQDINGGGGDFNARSGEERLKRRNGRGASIGGPRIRR